MLGIFLIEIEDIGQNVQLKSLLAIAYDFLDKLLVLPICSEHDIHTNSEVSPESISASEAMPSLAQS